MEEVVNTLDAHVTSRKIWSWFGDPDREKSSAFLREQILPLIDED